MPQEVVDRLAEQRRGTKQSQETIDKRISKVRGQTRTEEEKKKFSEIRLSKNPWEIKPAKIETWQKADIYYEVWLEQKSPYSAARSLGLTHGSLAAMWKWFERGYVPFENEIWLKTFKEEIKEA